MPAGTRLVIRMSDTLDSKRHSAGHRFRAQLDGAVVIDGITVLPRGTQLQGQITSSGQARRAAGSSNLSVTFTDVILNDEFIPISTGALSAQTGNEAGRTLGRTARAAAIGGLIDGSSGARTGAAIGAGASLLTSGASINIPLPGCIRNSARVAPPSHCTDSAFRQRNRYSGVFLNHRQDRRFPIMNYYDEKQ